MVNYNPKDWFRFIITFNRADTVRKLLPLLVGIGVYSFIVVLIIELLNLTDNPHLKNLSLWKGSSQKVHRSAFITYG